MANVNVADVMARQRATRAAMIRESGGEQHSTTEGDGNGTISTMSFPLPHDDDDFPLGLVTANQIARVSQAQQHRLFRFVRQGIRGGPGGVNDTSYATAQRIREQFSQCGVEFLPTPYETYTQAGADASRNHYQSISRDNQPMAHWRSYLTYWLFWLSHQSGAEHDAFVYRVIETLYLVAYYFKLFPTA